MNIHTPIRVDRDQIARFVNALFRHAQEGTFVSLRTLPQSGKGNSLIEAVRIGASLDAVARKAACAAQNSAETEPPTMFAPPIATFNHSKRARAVDVADGLAITVDLDKDPSNGRTTLEKLLGPPTVAVESGSQWTDPVTGELAAKLHLHWRLQAPARDAGAHERLRQAREIASRLAGGDCSGAPIAHPFRWPGSLNRKSNRPTLAQIAEMNEHVEIDLEEALRRLETAAGNLPGSTAPASSETSTDVTRTPLKTLAKTIMYVPNEESDDDSYELWINFGIALSNETDGSPEGLEIWREWSARSPKYRPGECEMKWRSFPKMRDNNPITGRAIMYEARKHGYKDDDADADFDGIDPDDDRAPPEADCVPPDMSDDAITVAFVQKNSRRLRYTATEGNWRVFDGTVWNLDVALSVRNDVREVCRRLASKAAKSTNKRKKNYARTVASKKTMAAVEHIAKADPSLRAAMEQWDVDPWLLNTPGGVVNLRDGSTGASSPGGYHTKITAVAAGGECPLWMKFLHSITNDDKDLELYLQRAAGYWLTGSTQEQALFFCYGSGANGKGVFLNTISRIMNTYASVSNMETFTASKHARHPTEVARLNGARLVTCQETEQSKSWAEALVKAITGGDAITAHFMRQDEFTFDPKLKLVIAGNHKPRITNCDDAMRRRLQLIPFSVHFPEGERDLQLPEKLKDEWSGILRWCINGCLEWQRTGLARPQSVKSATAEYFEEEDSVARWIGECCDLGKEYRTGTAELFESWDRWARRTGEMSETQTWLTRSLKRRELTDEKMPKTGRSGLRGIRVRSPKEEDSGFLG